MNSKETIDLSDITKELSVEWIEVSNVNFEDRLKVPIGLKKKEYESLLKETQKSIDLYVKLMRGANENLKALYDSFREDYVERKRKINNNLDFLKKDEVGSLLDIQRAKQYPIEELLDFSGGGFTKCLWHDQTVHKSLHLHKKINKVKCFSCGVSKDVIDVYQQLSGATLKEAINYLSR